jgi:hypothetical protein
MSFSDQPPPAWGTDYFRDASPNGVAALGRGLIDHVSIIAGLMIVQGLMEVLLGFVCLGVAGIVFLVPESEFDRSDKLLIAGIYGFIGIPAVSCAVLRFMAAYYSLHYRRRRLGIAALAIGLLSVMTGLCALTAIALAIYGLVVYVNDSVVAAFRLGDQGRSRAEINALFHQ